MTKALNLKQKQLLNLIKPKTLNQLEHWVTLNVILVYIKIEIVNQRCFSKKCSGVIYKYPANSPEYNHAEMRFQ